MSDLELQQSTCVEIQEIPEATSMATVTCAASCSRGGDDPKTEQTEIDAPRRARQENEENSVLLKMHNRDFSPREPQRGRPIKAAAGSADGRF